MHAGPIVSELVLATCKREDTAAHMRAVLRAHGDDLAIDLDSVLWGAHFGLVFLVPTPGTARGPKLGAFFGTMDRAGLDEEFRVRIRDALGWPVSGLTFLATGWDAELVLERLSLQPDVLLRASLSLEQDGEPGDLPPQGRHPWEEVLSCA